MAAPSPGAAAARGGGGLGPLPSAAEPRRRHGTGGRGGALRARAACHATPLTVAGGGTAGKRRRGACLRLLGRGRRGGGVRAPFPPSRPERGSGREGRVRGPRCTCGCVAAADGAERRCGVRSVTAPCCADSVLLSFLLSRQQRSS